jgi:hypothetical protein
VAQNLAFGVRNALFFNVTTNLHSTSTNIGNLVLPPLNPSFTYDLDGNLSGDGVWTYTWDGGNRWTMMESVAGLTNIARKRLE